MREAICIYILIVQSQRMFFVHKMHESTGLSAYCKGVYSSCYRPTTEKHFTYIRAHSHFCFVYVWLPHFVLPSILNFPVSLSVLSSVLIFLLFYLFLFLAQCWQTT